MAKNFEFIDIASSSELPPLRLDSANLPLSTLSTIIEEPIEYPGDGSPSSPVSLSDTRNPCWWELSISVEGVANQQSDIAQKISPFDVDSVRTTMIVEISVRITVLGE